LREDLDRGRALCEEALERAATLLGAAEALQERQGNAWPPDEAPHFQRSRAAVADALDRDQLDRAWSEGKGMSSAQAVRSALAARSSNPSLPAASGS